MVQTTTGLIEEEPKSYKQQLAERREASEFRIACARATMIEMLSWVLTFLPLVAPVPSLVNLAFALWPTMGVIAIVVSICIELMIFGASEITLLMLKRNMETAGNYLYGLIVALVGDVALLAVMFTLILAYEEHGTASLALPIVSVVSIVFMALRQWDEVRRNMEDEREYDDMAEQIDGVLQAVQESEAKMLLAIDTECNMAMDIMREEFNTATREDDTKLGTPKMDAAIEERQSRVAEMLQSGMTQSAIADTLGVTRQTVARDRKALQ